ncbi:MAG: hypothetical protein HQL13_05620 [Candidatus Omnitrophica bacterium]|nr:hypothetical protein [Candidatus Omnitrophota bacterium]
MKNILRNIASLVTLGAFLLNTTAASWAQIPHLPLPGTMVSLSMPFKPSLIKGIIIHPENPLRFDFIINKGDENLSLSQKKVIYKRLIKYFMASLAVPDRDQWVTY